MYDGVRQGCDQGTQEVAACMNSLFGRGALRLVPVLVRVRALELANLNGIVPVT